MRLNHLNFAQRFHLTVYLVYKRRLRLNRTAPIWHFCTKLAHMIYCHSRFFINSLNWVMSWHSVLSIRWTICSVSCAMFNDPITFLHGPWKWAVYLYTNYRTYIYHFLHGETQITSIPWQNGPFCDGIDVICVGIRDSFGARPLWNAVNVFQLRGRIRGLSKFFEASLMQYLCKSD